MNPVKPELPINIDKEYEFFTIDKNKSSIVSTGDNSNIGFEMILLLGSGIMIASLLALKKVIGHKNL